MKQYQKILKMLPWASFNDLRGHLNNLAASELRALRAHIEKRQQEISPLSFEGGQIVQLNLLF